MVIIDDEDLNLKCQSDQLSELQVGIRNRKISNVALIKSFMHASFNQGSENNNEGFAALTNLINLHQKDVPQYMPYPVNNSGTGRYNRNYNKVGTQMKNGISPNASSTRKQKTTKAPVKPISAVTQSLRATRKSTGSLPPPKVDLHQVEDSDPEIEVIQESNPTRLKVVSKLNATSTVSRTSGAAKSAGNPVILLNINVRPQNLSTPQQNMTSRRELDAKVKTILIKTAPEFIEWLLNEGFIRSVQHCSQHKNFAGQPAKLKLGMFSDPKVNIVSGGYVWLAECCVRKYISVFSGSLFASFDEEKIPPTSVIKLIYHWSCQTTISNVETWVKIAKNLVSRVYQYMRCICSIVVHNKVYDFGSNYTDVELGIVSLGTTTADGLKKAVKVEILGLYDRHTSAYRLFACTPEPANSSRERFTRILKPVLQVVHSNATLICDYSVDPSTLNYKRVHMCSTDDPNDSRSNSTIMTYLRKHVPKMFQTNLSQLTEYQVQLVLDELCWREKYAKTAASCYEIICGHISYITSQETENAGVIPLLKSVGENPHKLWRYRHISNPIQQTMPQPTILVATDTPVIHESQIPDVKIANPSIHSNKINSLLPEPQKKTRQMPHTPVAIQPTIPKPDNYMETAKSSVMRDPGFQDLEQYFYSKLDVDFSRGAEVNSCNFKCSTCSEDFGNDNISFYTHIQLHIQGHTLERENISKACQYCCTILKVGQVAAHIVNDHMMADIGQLWCRICSVQFFNDNQLKTHMMKKHVEAEMPYRCAVCGYATSFYYDAIDHFDKIHRGTPYVQCRLCLAVKTITPANEATFSLTMMQHCQKHSLKLACKNCQLNFYNKVNHTEHRKEHLSCSNVKNIIRYKAPTGCRLLEFRPVIRNGPIKTAEVETNCEPANGFVSLSLAINTYKKLKLNIPDDFDCWECGKNLKADGCHFRTVRKCTKCSYTTSCLAGLFKHVDMFHPSYNSTKKKHELGNPTTLPYVMYCVCGFSTRTGNNLARHMSIMQHHNSTAALPESIEEMDIDDLDDEIPEGFQMPLAVEMSEG